MGRAFNVNVPFQCAGFLKDFEGLSYRPVLLELKFLKLMDPIVTLTFDNFSHSWYFHNFQRLIYVTHLYICIILENEDETSKCDQDTKV